MTAFSTQDDKSLTQEAPGTFQIIDPKDQSIVAYLPVDTICTLEGEKVIAESKILDGGYVYERVSLKPYQINFDFTIREKDIKKAFISKLGFNSKWIFPQTETELLNTNWFKKDEILEVTNTFLNGLGISKIIVKSISLNPERGTTDIKGNIKAFEDTGEDSSTLTIV
jgi:hypothetical protein